jgi:hypothetical protein
MSDTTDFSEAPTLKAIPNYTCTLVHDENPQGEKITVANVTFGEPARKLQVREPDMGDQFDLLEMGGAATNNETWMGMALVANAVRIIDGLPVMPFRPERLDMSKNTLRSTIKKLGPVGLAAAGRAIAEMSKSPLSAEAIVEAAKN